MKLEDQVCSLELAKRLRGLGVGQLSQFLWNQDGFISFRVAPSDKTWPGEYAAFTVAELGEMLKENHLPEYVTSDGDWCGDAGDNWVSEKTEADARALMLCYLIEKGLAKP